MIFKSKARYDQLDHYLARRDYAAALEAVSEELKRRPEDFNLLLRHAEILGLAGDKEHAVQVYRRLAHHFADQGFYARAIAVNNKILRLDPSRREATDELAELIAAREEEERLTHGAVSAAEETPAAPAFLPTAAAPVFAPAAGTVPPFTPAPAPTAPETAPVPRATAATAPQPAVPPPIGPPPVAPPPIVPPPIAPSAPPQTQSPAATLTAPPPPPQVPEEPDDDLPGAPPAHEPVVPAMSILGPTEVIERAAPDTAARERDASRFFAAFPRQALNRLLAATKVSHYAPDQIIVMEGEPGSSMFLIVAGDVSVQTVDPAGGPLQLATLGPGEFFGEVALLTGRPRTATVIARNNVTAVEIPRPKVQSILTSFPEVGQIIQQFLEQRAQATAEAIRRSLSGTRGG
jgi:cAMP-dependent protein kinase regulator